MVLKGVDMYLKRAYELGASDVHFSAGLPCKIRIDGDIVDYNDEVISNDQLRLLINEMLVDRISLDQFKEYDFSYEIEGLSRYRVNIFNSMNTFSLSIRAIPGKIATLEDLDSPYIFKEFANKKQGLVLVTGPTGSGKSTTLAAMVDYINSKDKKHILTLEDPIEFVHTSKRSLVNQRQIGIDTDSFASGLRSSLRQDPDVILIGEMRDLDTISIALTAAETGHLVFGTLHTKDAPSSIDRIVDVFPPEQQAQVKVQLSEVLVGVISQRLLKKRSGGRVAAYEIMVMVPAIKNLIRTGKIHQVKNMMQMGKSQGMVLMENSVKELVDKGIVEDTYLE